MATIEIRDSNYYAKRIADFMLKEHFEPNPDYDQLFYIPEEDDLDFDLKLPNQSRKLLDEMVRDYEAALTSELIASMPE